MSGTNPLPAPRPAILFRGRQPIFSSSNSRRTISEGPYGGSLPRTSSTSRSGENPFANFDGEFASTSTPLSTRSPDSYRVTPLDSESDPEEQGAAPKLETNRRLSRFRERFELDSNELANAQPINGDTGHRKANAEAVPNDEDAGDEQVLARQVLRRRPAFRHRASQHSQSTAAEQVGVESTIDDEDGLDSLWLNNFVQSGSFGTSGPQTRTGVREQGLQEWEMVPRVDEVKSSSRKHKSGSTHEKAKKSEGFWGIQDKFWDLKEVCTR